MSAQHKASTVETEMSLKLSSNPAWYHKINIPSQAMLDRQQTDTTDKLHTNYENKDRYETNAF